MHGVFSKLSPRIQHFSGQAFHVADFRDTKNAGERSEQ
jgi:hypothetical protein